MPGQWQGSTRSARLPDDWDERCAFVWQRDGDICWLCNEHGADTIDHKHHGDDHQVTNLAPVHDRAYPHCHRYKSSREGNTARWHYRNARPKQRHPAFRTLD